MMNVEREHVRQCVARLFFGGYGAEAAGELTDYVEQSAPALWSLIERKVERPKPDRRTATDSFLRTLPGPLFDHLLVLSLGFFRPGARELDDPVDEATELCALAFVLWLDEQGLEDYPATDEEFYVLTDRFARLVSLEEKRRFGAFARINRYSMLAPVTDEFPSRRPVGIG